MYIGIPIVDALVPPVLPQRGHSAQGACTGTVPSRHPLPLPALRARRTSSAVYGLAALDCHGRVADRIIMQTLDWSAGLRLHIRETATGALTAAADPEGVYRSPVTVMSVYPPRCGTATGCVRGIGCCWRLIPNGHSW